MNLIELSKMKVGSLRVIDKSFERGEPLKWHNLITIINGKKSVTVRRYTAYNHGFCEGAKGLRLNRKNQIYDKILDVKTQR